MNQKKYKEALIYAYKLHEKQKLEKIHRIK